MNEQFSIAGKVAVITGAGGVLGGSIAKCFMEQGAKVVAVDMSVIKFWESELLSFGSYI